MALLDSFGFSQFTEAFRKSGGVHEVWNLLSLDPNLHRTLDRLDMWFEGTKKGAVHRYLSVTPTNSVYSQAVTKSACFIIGMNYISTTTLSALHLTSTVHLWLSTLLHDMRMHHHRPTPVYSPFMQYVLELLTCLVLPNILTR